MAQNYIKVGGRLESTAEPRNDASNFHIIAGANAIYDDDQGRTQDKVNADVNRHEAEINGTNGLDERTTAAERDIDQLQTLTTKHETEISSSGGIKDRLSTLEQAGQIVINGGSNPITTNGYEVSANSGKIPTGAAVKKALNVQSGYFVCRTTAGTSAKVIDYNSNFPNENSNIQDYVLPLNGGCIKVKFLEKNTSPQATLNINNTGAKKLYYYGEEVSTANTWMAGEIVEIYYDAAANEGRGGFFANSVEHNYATNIRSWAERTELTMEETWSDYVRVTANDQSIDSEQQAKLVSIVAKENEFSLEGIKTTGFNLLHDSVTVDTGYFFVVPMLQFGRFATKRQPNGILFTNNNKENITPTVYFKKLTDGIPTSANDGTLCTYVDSNGYRFYTTPEPGYMIVSGISRPDVCAHIGESKRYDEYIPYNSAEDTGSLIDLTSVINPIHGNGKMYVCNNVADSISFTSNTTAIWTRRVDKLEPIWTTEESEGTFTHFVIINDINPNSIPVCGDLHLHVDGTKVWYSDSEEEGTVEPIYYELLNPVRGTVNISSLYKVEDWGLEILINPTGRAYITTQYAQNYPDTLADIASSVLNEKTQVLAEGLAQHNARLDYLEQNRNKFGHVETDTINSQEMPKVMGDDLIVLAEEAPTLVPKFVGQIYIDIANTVIYVSKSITDSLSDWFKVDLPNSIAAAILVAITNLTNKLTSGEVVPALAQNIYDWAERKELTVENSWTDFVRTTAGDIHIDDTIPARLLSIVAEEDCSADSLKSTRFNLLGNATVINGGYCILVPALPFGTFGMSDKPNGVLFTNRQGENISPIVYFKKYTDGFPENATDGIICDSVVSNGYTFFTCQEPGYMLVSDIVYNNTCMHIAWGHDYDRFVAPSAGTTIDLKDVINEVHSDVKKLLAINTGHYLVADEIQFGTEIATWHRRVGRVKPTWTTEEIAHVNEGTEEESFTYLHSATISGMKANGLIEFENGLHNYIIDGNVISYTDHEAEPVDTFIKYELTSEVVGEFAETNPYIVDNNGLEYFENATGKAYVTARYTQTYPESIANLLHRVDNNIIPVISEAFASQNERIKALEDMLLGQSKIDLKVRTLDAEDILICGNKVVLSGEGAPEIVPRFIGQKYLDLTNNKVYTAFQLTNSTGDWH